jgi:hypothetical protein
MYIIKQNISLWDFRFSRRRVWSLESSGIYYHVVKYIRPTFQRCMLPPSSGRYDGGGTHLWNVGRHLFDYTTVYPRRLWTSKYILYCRHIVHLFIFSFIFLFSWVIVWLHIVVSPVKAVSPCKTTRCHNSHRGYNFHIITFPNEFIIRRSSFVNISFRSYPIYRKISITELHLLFLATRFPKMNYKLISLTNPFQISRSWPQFNNFDIMFRQLNYSFLDSRFNRRKENKKIHCVRHRFIDAERTGKFFTSR